MILRENENKKMMSLYMEAPQECEDISGVGSILDDSSNVSKIQQCGIMMGNSPYGTIYASQDITSSTKSFHVISNNQIIIYYQYVKVTNDYIRTKLTRGSKEHNGAFMKFFLYYILPSFKTVECDGQLSKLGYKFWEKLFDYNHLIIYVVDDLNKKVARLNHKDELKQYYGQTDEYQHYRYVVSMHDREPSEILRLARTKIE